MNGLKLCLALASVTGVAAFSEYEQGPVYDQWSLFTEQAGKWRGVWKILDGGFAPFPDQQVPPDVNPRKVETFLDLSADGTSISQTNTYYTMAEEEYFKLGPLPPYLEDSPPIMASRCRRTGRPARWARSRSNGRRRAGASASSPTWKPRMSPRPDLLRISGVSTSSSSRCRRAGQPTDRDEPLPPRASRVSTAS